MLTTTIEPQQHLYIESNTDVPTLHPVASGNVVAFCRRCPDRSDLNDDSAAIVQTSCGAIVMIVADGVGGCPLGYKASAIAVSAVGEIVQQAEPMSDLRPSILDGIERANEEILDLGVGAATTLAVVEIQDGKARAYQVGDSMTVILGQRGALKWKSTPHSPVGYAVESGMLDESEAIHHDERHVVSNLVGSRSMHIEIGPSQPLSPRDTVVVASDGLFDNLHLDEVIEHGRSGNPVERMQRLTQLANARMTKFDPDLPGKPDDLTVLLYTA